MTQSPLGTKTNNADPLQPGATWTNYRLFLHRSFSDKMKPIFQCQISHRNLAEEKKISSLNDFYFSIFRKYLSELLRSLMTERMYHVVLSSDLMQVNADSRHVIAHWQASMTTSAYTFKDPIMSLFHWERVSKAIVIRWQNQAQKSRKPLLLQYCRTHSEFSYYNLQIIFYDTLSLWQQQQHSIVSPWNISENKESSWLILKLLKN